MLLKLFKLSRTDLFRKVDGWVALFVLQGVTLRVLVPPLRHLLLLLLLLHVVLIAVQGRASLLLLLLLLGRWCGQRRQ